MLLLTALVSIKVYMNFDKGLARALPRYRKHGPRHLPRQKTDSNQGTVHAEQEEMEEARPTID